MATKSQPSPQRKAAPPSKPNARTPQRPQQSDHDGPVGKVNHYPVEAAIWHNFTQDGKSMYSVSFQRSYKTREGEWKRSTSFSGTDLLVLAQCATEAYHRIEDLRRADREEQPRPARQSNGYVTDEDVPF